MRLSIENFIFLKIKGVNGILFGETVLFFEGWGSFYNKFIFLVTCDCIIYEKIIASYFSLCNYSIFKRPA